MLVVRLRLIDSTLFTGDRFDRPQIDYLANDLDLTRDLGVEDARW